METLRAAGSSRGVLGGLQTAVTHGEIRGQACVPLLPVLQGETAASSEQPVERGASREPGPQRVREGGGWRQGPGGGLGARRHPQRQCPGSASGPGTPGHRLTIGKGRPGALNWEVSTSP